jgi:hypothetical protein
MTIGSGVAISPALRARTLSTLAGEGYSSRVLIRPWSSHG